MNKYIAYIIGTLLAGALVLLFLTGENKKKRRYINETVTLKRQDKIPYGTYVAYQDLKYIFPGATIYTNKNEPGYWDSIFTYESNQALIIVCPSFRADDHEMRRLVRFAKNGNDVFISTRYLSAVADRILQCNSSAYDLTYIAADRLADSMRIKLEGPPFEQPLIYSYPGKTFLTYFTHIDSLTTEVLGKDEFNRANFIHLRTGKGNFYVHTEPLAFSNYFVLHKNNKEYYEKALSVISPDVTRVAWDEYYLDKKEDFVIPEPREKKDWFATLMNMKNDNDQRSFGIAFWLLILILLLYVLLGMRRKQRPIPVIAKPSNDSLDFVKTIGRLYYDRGDHKNLCKKMSAYFLEHVRNKYKLPTGLLDDNFINQLKFKTGVPEHELRGIVSFIKYLDDEPLISSGSLTDFHKHLESFYKKA